MRKNLPIFLFVFGLSISALAQHEKQIVEFEMRYKEGGSGVAQEIVKYTSVEGKVVTKEVIFTSDTLDVRFDLGENRVIDDHWFINYWGDVVDLKLRKLVFNGDGTTVAIINHKVMIDRDRTDDDNIYSYDLNTGKAVRIETREDIENLEDAHFSPSSKLVVQWTAKTGYAFFSVDEKLNLKLLKKMPGTFDASCGAVCSDNRRVPPIMWLDNSTILTQRSNGKLVTVNVKGKVEKIVDMKLEEQPGSLPNLDRDDDGNIVYFCDREYLIDVKNKKFSKK